jgi:predicted RNase H-like HicB family nuclease
LIAPRKNRGRRRLRAEPARLIHEVIEFHLEGLRQDGVPIPRPHSSSELIEVRA